jgi:hypothetical protein
MDPNAALADIRSILADRAEDGSWDADQLAERINDLDNWLTRGGFLPADWQR